MEDKRKLRVLVITTDGSERQKRIMELFSQPEMAAHFDPPEFSPSVPSRSLRNRYEFFRIANEAGLLPSCEWQAIKEAQESKRYETSPEKFLDCLKHLPVTQGRRGSKSDLKLHYSCEVRVYKILPWFIFSALRPVCYECVYIFSSCPITLSSSFGTRQRLSIGAGLSLAAPWHI